MTAVRMAMHAQTRKAGLRRPSGTAGGSRDQRGSVPPVLSAASSTLSPTFWTSLPTPLTVLHADSVPIVNRASSSSAIERFMVISWESAWWLARGRSADTVPSGQPAREGHVPARASRDTRRTSRSVSCARRSIAHQRGFAEQALHQVHRQLRGGIAFVLRGFDLDDVERAHSSRVGAHFHLQLCPAAVEA